MEFQIGYGLGEQTVMVEEQRLSAVILPNKPKGYGTEEEIIRKALDQPVNTPPLEVLAKGKSNVVIITSDFTRPMPSYRVLPMILERLYKGGVTKKQITIIFAMGSHRLHTEEEKRKLVGDAVFEAIRCMDSSQCEMIHLGETKEGTPVDIADCVAYADLKICLGNVEYHFFAGYSGGAKAIMPGVSTRSAIRMNHRKMIHPMCRAGILDGNPVREDLEEATGICGVDFILNVVLDEHKNIIYGAAGELKGAHRAACKFLDSIFKIEITELADIVIVSQGGAPKDVNLYQTQKALANAEYAVKQGGIIILAGACPEGLGESTFETWMREADSIEEILERIQQDFQIGGHKAASFARAIQRADIYVVSQINPELIREIFMTPFTTVQEAYKKASEVKGENARVTIMPYGGSTLPVFIDPIQN